MDEKVLKWITPFVVVMTAAVCIGLLFFPKLHEYSVLAAEKRLLREQAYAQSDHASFEQDPEEIVEQTDGGRDSQLKIELPDGITLSDLTIENHYLTRDVFIRIPQAPDDYFSRYRVQGSCDHISAISYYQEKEDGVIILGLDRVFELEEDYQSGNLYLNFLDPHEVYDKIVVIDAGHGGRASGAAKIGISEKDINLAIVLELKGILDENTENIGVYYTRTDDSNPTLDQRVQLANAVQADLFLSVHNNSTATGKFSGISGTEVLFDEADDSELSSRRLAQICLDEVTDALGSSKRGLLEGDNIYIIRTSEVPVALIEVGFMTNRKELDALTSPEYQKQAAEGIYAAILRAFEEGY